MKVSQLKLNKKNPRKISPEQLEKLKTSIQKFPKMMSLRPIVYDPDTMQVLGGNQRLIAIKELGMKEIPDTWVKSADELTEEEKREFILRDNIQSGDWDFEILEAEFNDFALEEMGIELPNLLEIDLNTNKDRDIKIEPKEYTEEDIENAQREIELKQAQKELKEVICPKCGEVFYVE